MGCEITKFAELDCLVASLGEMFAMTMLVMAMSSTKIYFDNSHTNNDYYY
jgi:hypothetical protein